MPVIEAIELRRTYRTTTGVVRRKPLEVEAVRGVSFAVERGELFGLLGPNGAGKTTTIKMLITLLLPTSGEARVLGHDVVADAREVRKRIGYVFGGDRGLYERLSAYDNLRYFAELYGVSGKAQRRRIDEVLELVGLKGREQERVEGYSRGMRQRLHIARGILHDPEVVFLDEPTIGVDPVGARELRQTIADLVAAGKTVLLTTHYMFEADALCDRIAVIAKGQIVGEGTPAQLKDERRRAGASPRSRSSASTTPTVARLRELDGVTAVTVEERDQAQLLVVQTSGEREVTAPLLARARRPRGRPRLVARADARGRVRLARHGGMTHRARVFWIGWVLHFKNLSASPFMIGVGGGVAARLRDARVPDVPRDGRRRPSLLYAALGAAVMGIWSTHRDERRRRDPAAALVGRARAARRGARAADPRARADDGRDRRHRRLLDRSRRSSGDGSSSACRCHIEHPLAVRALGARHARLRSELLGFVLCMILVLFRAASHIGNSLEYPVWHAQRAACFRSQCCPRGRTRSRWSLATTWGMSALLHGSLGGPVWRDLAMCALLTVVYAVIGIAILDRFLDAARRSATLSLT